MDDEVQKMMRHKNERLIERQRRRCDGVRRTSVCCSTWIVWAS